MFQTYTTLHYTTHTHAHVRTQLHRNAFIYIIFLNVHITHSIVGHTFYTDSVYESTV